MWSTQTAGMFVGDKDDARQAGTAAATADYGLIKTGWHSIEVLPSVPFVVEGGSTDVFKKRHYMVGSEMPGVTVIS